MTQVSKAARYGDPRPVKLAFRRLKQHGHFELASMDYRVRQENLPQPKQIKLPDQNEIKQNTQKQKNTKSPKKVGLLYFIFLFF